MQGPGGPAQTFYAPVWWVLRRWGPGGERGPPNSGPKVVWSPGGSRVHRASLPKRPKLLAGTPRQTREGASSDLLSPWGGCQDDEGGLALRLGPQSGLLTHSKLKHRSPGTNGARASRFWSLGGGGRSTARVGLGGVRCSILAQIPPHTFKKATWQRKAGAGGRAGGTASSCSTHKRSSHGSTATGGQHSTVCYGWRVTGGEYGTPSWPGLAQGSSKLALLKSGAALSMHVLPTAQEQVVQPFQTTACVQRAAGTPPAPLDPQLPAAFSHQPRTLPSPHNTQGKQKSIEVG